MQITEMMVQPLIDSEDIEFGDSSCYLEEMLEEGRVDSDTYLFYTSTAGNPFAKSMIVEIKLSECDPKFIESVEETGIQRPITMVDKTIIDGHHRLAVAHHLGITVPVAAFHDWDDWSFREEKKYGLVCFDGEL